MARTEPSIQLVVCDAGPIIHLDELECLDLLDSFSEVLIPNVVWNEIERHRPQAIPVCQQIAKQVFSAQPLTPDIKAIVQVFSLHAGEIQALNVVQEFQADLFLTDDTAARLAAGSMKIAVHGTLGILLRAIRMNQLSASEVLLVLKSIPDKSTLHLKASLLEQIIDQVKSTF